MMDSSLEKSKICSRASKRRNTNGFSLLELLVAAGIISGIVMITFTFTSDLMKFADGERRKTEFIIDSNLGIQQIWPLISAMRPSMNNVKIPDDNARNFFDYNTDSTIPLSPGDDQKRILTLKDEFDTFDFLAEEPNRGTTTLYNPAYAYNASAMFDSRVLSFVGINNDGYLSVKLRPDPPPPNNLLSSGKLLLFQSPIYLRSMASITDTDYNAPGYVAEIPRNFAFLGHWKSPNELIKNTFDGQFNFEHPLKPTLDVPNIDVYFRNLPPSLAGGNFTTVAPVIGYRLTVRKSQGDPTGKLRDIYFLKWEPATASFPAGSRTGALGDTSVLLRNISGLRLIRDHISNPIIRIEVLQ